MTAWAEAVVAATVAAYEPLASPADAAPMVAYMKGVAPFLGIKAPQRRAVQRDAWAPHGRPTPADLRAAAHALWARPEREYQYAACDLLGWFAPRVAGASFLVDAVEPLLVTKPWWDTVDGLGSAAVRPLLTRHPALVGDVVPRWSESGDRWLVRSAILHQLGAKAAVDEARLFALCRRHADDREFFVAKAIGWALRDHARTAPAAVRAFLAATPLQPLSVREAAKHLPPANG